MQNNLGTAMATSQSKDLNKRIKGEIEPGGDLPGSPASGERTPRPDCRAVLPQKDGGHGADDGGDKGQCCVAPAEAQRPVQGRAEEGEAEAGEAAEDDDGGHGAGGVARVRVDNVRLVALERDHGPEPEDADADVGPDPVRTRLRRPTVHQDAGRRQHRRREYQRHAELRPSRATVAFLERDIDLTAAFAPLPAKQRKGGNEDVSEMNGVGAPGFGNPKHGEKRGRKEKKTLPRH